MVRYSVTMREPGASDVLMCGATFRPASTAFFASRPAASSTLGFDVLVHDVIAAISTSPFFTSTPFDVVVLRVQVGGLLRETVFADRLREQAGEGGLHVTDFDPVLRALRTGQRRGDRGEIQRDDLRVIDAAGLRNAEQVLRLEVVLEGGDFSVGAARALEVVDGFFVDREKAHRAPYSGAMLPIVARSGSDSDFVPSPKNSTNLPTTFSLRSSSVIVSTRSVAVTPSRSLPFSSTPTTSGVRKYTGWPSMPASASMPPTPQPTTPMPLIIVVWLSVPDERIRVVHGVAAVGLLVNAACEVFQVHLVDDADAGRHDLECVERLHAPLHELIALVVALEFQFHVQVERVLFAEVIDLHRVVDDQIDRHQRFDRLRILACALRDAAHRSDVGEQRNAGEVLQHDARHDERNFIGTVGDRFPVRELLDMFDGDLLPS